jgi:hypothetical protein
MEHHKNANLRFSHTHTHTHTHILFLFLGKKREKKIGKVFTSKTISERRKSENAMRMIIGIEKDFPLVSLTYVYSSTIIADEVKSI